ncbi:MAG: DNA replication complex GINS family protein [Methanotrichaceae archaeon]|nr:DNA replication complex GINS family protein [Methanotrichaceae archaeon]
MDLANALREERKMAELQSLDKGYYRQVGSHLAELQRELSQVKDPYCVEAQILQDTLKSERSIVNKLIDQRIKKIVRKAVRSARSASRDEVPSGLTSEEEEIYRGMLSAIVEGRETILHHLANTERPLTGKKDIPREYEIVRLLEEVPMFVGVDGRNYLLSRDDVVALPAVHAKNLRNKNLAALVKFEEMI